MFVCSDWPSVCSFWALVERVLGWLMQWLACFMRAWMLIQATAVLSLSCLSVVSGVCLFACFCFRRHLCSLLCWVVLSALCVRWWWWVLATFRPALRTLIGLACLAGAMLLLYSFHTILLWDKVLCVHVNWFCLHCARRNLLAPTDRAACFINACVKMIMPLGGLFLGSYLGCVLTCFMYEDMQVSRRKTPGSDSVQFQE
jgi:hypothetical protein